MLVIKIIVRISPDVYEKFDRNLFVDYYRLEFFITAYSPWKEQTFYYFAKELFDASISNCLEEVSNLLFGNPITQLHMFQYNIYPRRSSYRKLDWHYKLAGGLTHCASH